MNKEIRISELKERAKEAFRGKYWTAFGVCLILIVIAAVLGGDTGSGVTLSFNLSGFGTGFINGLSSDSEEIVYVDGSMPQDVAGPALVILAAVFILIMVVGLIFSLVRDAFILNPLNVGQKSFFMKNRTSVGEVTDLFKVFTRGKYLKTVGTMFTTNIFIWLWTWVFIIPGIYFTYVWWAVPYLCAENPELSSSEARRISRAMTDGYKVDIFITSLSFIGWRILSAFVILGAAFIEPYVQATFAELYVELRDRAVSSGKVTAAEVGLCVEVDDPFEQEPKPFETV